MFEILTARRKVATMFYLEHLSTGEIAKKLNMPLNTVLSHLRRFCIVAVSALQQWMKQVDGLGE
jgi:DNA-directed RNA polymerase specialized sigma24 family protein